jgi:hypothetical protein
MGSRSQRRGKRDRQQRSSMPLVSPPQQSVPDKQSASRRQYVKSFRWLGIICTAVSTLSVLTIVTLKPQLIISPQGPLTAETMFAQPITFTNTGYLTAVNVELYCYIHYVYLDRPNCGGMVNEIIGWSGPGSTLEQGESKTVTCPLTNATVAMADVALIAQYSIRGIPVLRSTRIERLRGMQAPDGLRLAPQPSTLIKALALDAIERWRGLHISGVK